MMCACNITSCQGSYLCKTVQESSKNYKDQTGRTYDLYLSLPLTFEGQHIFLTRYPILTMVPLCKIVKSLKAWTNYNSENLDPLATILLHSVLLRLYKVLCIVNYDKSGFTCFVPLKNSYELNPSSSTQFSNLQRYTQ